MQKMLREFVDQPAMLSKAASANQGIVNLVTDIVRRGQAKGELRDQFAPELAAVSIVSTWSALAAWWTGNPDASTGTEHDNPSLQIIDLTLNGLKRRS
jgi:hypothetical protein